MLHPSVLQQEMVEVTLVRPTATEAINVVPFAFSSAQTAFNKQILFATVKLEPNPERHESIYKCKWTAYSLKRCYHYIHYSF